MNNPPGLKFLTRLRIGFSHLKEHKFKHNFQDSVDPLRSYVNDIGISSSFLSLLRKFYNSKADPFEETKKYIQLFWLKMKIQLSERSYLEDQTLLIQLTKKSLIPALVSF